MWTKLALVGAALALIAVALSQAPWPLAHAAAPVPTTFELAMVADMDLRSRDAAQNRWTSHVKHGKMQRKENGMYELIIDHDFPIHTQMAHKNRGMELSDLVLWNGVLYSFCDYTGLVHEIDLVERKSFPRWIVLDGNGRSQKPAKLEWATVKDGELYIGSIGKEWVQGGKILHKDPMWVHKISANGAMTHINWERQYETLRAATNASFPGYMIHEAVLWHPDLKQWVFLPRKHSTDTPYAEETDEVLASNLVLLADEEFAAVQVLRIGDLDPERGFSSVAAVPGTNLLAALKVRERAEGDVTETLFGVFDLQGRFYTEPHWIPVAHEKFEGLEFLSASS